MHAHGPLLVAALERLERLDGVSEQGRPPHNAHLSEGAGARRGGQRHGIGRLIGDPVAPRPQSTPNGLQSQRGRLWWQAVTLPRAMSQLETALQPAAYRHAAGRGRLVWRLHVDCGDLTLVDGDALNLQGCRGCAVWCRSRAAGDALEVQGARRPESTPGGGRGTARGGSGSRDGASAAEKVKPRPRKFAGSRVALRGRCRTLAARPTCACTCC